MGEVRGTALISRALEQRQGRGTSEEQVQSRFYMSGREFGNCSSESGTPVLGQWWTRWPGVGSGEKRSSPSPALTRAHQGPGADDITFFGDKIPGSLDEKRNIDNS